MKQSKLRLLIFSGWVVSWVFACIFVGAANWIRKGIDSQDVPDAIFLLTGVWMPIFGCLGTFWFGDPVVRKASNNATVAVERALGALALTSVYLCMLLIFILFAIYGIDPNRPEFSAATLPKDFAFVDRITACVKWAALTSTLGIAPVIWLTGIRSSMQHAPANVSAATNICGPANHSRNPAGQERQGMSQSSPGPSSQTKSPPAMKMQNGQMEFTDRPLVFIGHGRSPVWLVLKDFLQDRLKLQWEEFNSESAAGVATIERLTAMLDGAGFAFLVMTAEDLHADGKAHARENVIHEIGLFQGRLSFRRAIVLLEEGCEEFSNIHGLSQIRFPKGDILARAEEIRRVLGREGITNG